MKFMTKATMSNPNNFQNVLAKMREDKLFKEKENRTSAMAEKIMDGILSLTPEQQADQKTVLQVARDSFDPKATPAEKEIAIKMAFSFQQKAQSQNLYERQQKQFNRQEQDYLTNKADTALMAQSQRLAPHGGDEYSVPAEEPENYLNRLSDKGFLNYQTQKANTQREQEKFNLDKRFKESQIYKNMQPTGTAGNKAFERSKEESLNSLYADVRGAGGDFDPETMSFFLPTDKQGTKNNESVLNNLRQKGFEIIPVKGSVRKTDRPYWFTGDDYAQEYQVGGFNPKAQSDVGNKQPTSMFDELYNSIPKPDQSQNKPTQTQTQPVSKPKKVIETAKTMESPKQTGKRKPAINPVLPENVNAWNVKTIVKDGKQVKVAVLPHGEKVKLTPEEIKYYYKNKTNKALNTFTKWAGRNTKKE